MRQVLRPLKVASLSLIYSFLLTACDSSEFFPSDVDVNVDLKTTDVTLGNAEVITLGVLQSTIFAHQNAPLYDFLDASDLPVGAVKGVAENCLGGGTATYNTSRDALDVNGKPSVYLPGDSLSVDYEQCDNGLGSIFNGSINAVYDEIKGLNDTFVTMTTFDCVANLAEELSLGAIADRLSDPAFVAFLDSELNKGLDVNLKPVSFHQVNFPLNDGSHTIVYFVLGDAVRFKPLADVIEIEVLKTTDDPNNANGTLDMVLGTFTADRDDTVIIVNMLSKLDGNQNKLASLGGDQVFSLVKSIDQERSCQRYERTLNATLTNLTTQKGELATMLSGEVTLSERSQNFVRRDVAIENSDFTIQVQEGNLISDYVMQGYSIFKNIDNTTSSYSYKFNGDISSNVLFGRMRLINSTALTGHNSKDFPVTGIFLTLGMGLEQVRTTINELDLRLEIDFNGDSTGNGRSDFDDVIFTSWSELVDRSFKKVEFE